MLVKHALTHSAEVNLGRLADVDQRPVVDMLLEMLDQFVGRLEEDSGIADLGKRPASRKQQFSRRMASRQHRSEKSFYRLSPPDG